MVTLANKNNIEQAKKLWEISFGDSKEYVDFVFSNHFTHENVLVYLEDSKVIGIVCFEPFTLKSKTQSIPVVYLFAFAVHPDYRSKGIGGKLLKGFHKHMEANGYAATILTPATESLFNYYRSHGYEDYFYTKLASIPASYLEKDTAATLVPTNLADLSVVRDSFYLKHASQFASWNKSYLAFVNSELTLRSGGVARLSDDKGYLSYRKDSSVAEVLELVVPKENWLSSLTALHKELKAESYLIRLPVSYNINENITQEVKPFSMIYWHKKLKESSTDRSSFITYVMD